MQVIKLFEKENLFSSSIISSAYKVYINSLKRNLFNILPRQIFELVAILFIIFMTGFMLNYFSKEFVISTISVFVISLPRLIPILNSIIINLNTLNFGKPAINEITEIFNLKKDYEDKTHKIIGDFNEIMIEKLKFKFKNKKEYLFKINHLSIKKMKLLAL